MFRYEFETLSDWQESLWPETLGSYKSTLQGSPEVLVSPSEHGIAQFAAKLEANVLQGLCHLLSGVDTVNSTEML